MEELLSADYGTMFEMIMEIAADPASKPTEALLLFGILVIVLLIALVVVLAFVLGKPEDEDTDTPEPVPVGAEHAVRADASQVPGTPRTAIARRRTSMPARYVVAGALVLWWLATGVTTALPSVCVTCHVETVHSATGMSDPHEPTSCIGCHEAGGYLGALTTGLPRRIAHIASGTLTERPGSAYGYVESDSCLVCHSAGIAGTTTNDLRSVRISHREPLDAGAECLDCHRPLDGVVGASTTGMTPCLRCHDDTLAPGGCDHCHEGDTALAIVGRSLPSTLTAQTLIPNPDCGGCHDQATCDDCHGIRMPHSPEFKQYAHAREGVEDIWFNGGRTCGRCHTDSNRPCIECHTGQFPSHGTGFQPLHKAGGGEGAGCDTCHSAMAYHPRRDFCIDLCHPVDGP